MSEHQREPIDPFREALRRARALVVRGGGSGGVHVVLKVHDVQARRPHWSDEQAIRFLERHARELAHAMLRGGTDALGQLLEAHDDEQ